MCLSCCYTAASEEAKDVVSTILDVIRKKDIVFLFHFKLVIVICELYCQSNQSFAYNTYSSFLQRR